MRILYVEDDACLRAGMGEALRSEDHDLCEAQSCQRGLAMIQDQDVSFDVLITDIETPGDIDGWRLAELARSYRPSIQTIYTTGSSLANARPVADGRILRKPFTRSALLRCIGEVRPSAAGRRHLDVPLVA